VLWTAGTRITPHVAEPIRPVPSMNAVGLGVSDRVAGALLGSLAMFPLIDAIHTGELIASAAGGCNEFCLVIGIAGWLFLVAAVVLAGVGVSVWTGTRLGRVVGMVVAVGGVGWAAARVLALHGEDFTPRDAEVQGPIVIGAICLAATAMITISLIKWATTARG
jgi:hypothetical protein